MKDNMDYIKPHKKGAKGHKAMVVIGIIILNISIFLAAFVFSFNMIINPVEKRDTEVQTLTDENKKLKSDFQLVQDQLDVVESELDVYKDKYGSSLSKRSSASSEPKSTPKSTPGKDDEDEDDESGESESGGAESSESRRMNMDED